VIIGGIPQHFALRLEDKTGRFNLAFDASRIDAMQRFSISQSGTRCGGVIDDQEESSRLQCIEKSPVERRDIGWTQK
jgi:hypothetical protein